MKVFNVFSSFLVSDGFVIDYYSDALVNNIVGNFAQDTFNFENFAADSFDSAIQNAMFNSQGMGFTTPL